MNILDKKPARALKMWWDIGGIFSKYPFKILINQGL